MSNCKKIISLLLSLVMVLSAFSVVPVTVSAADADTVPSGDYPEIKPGDTVTVNIENGGDIAYLKFVPETDMTLFFYSVGDSDTFGYLYDKDMNEIKSDDESGLGSNFEISYYFTAGEVYYFGAKYYYSDIGAFDVVLLTEKPEWEHDGNIITRYNGTAAVVNIPTELDGVKITEIGTGAFQSRSSLKSVMIPDSVTKIGNNAFLNCSSLTSIDIPDSVTDIGRSAFSGCIKLTNITIPDTIAAINENTFGGCESLSAVIIPDSVTSIDYCAFSNCTGLKSVTLSKSLTEIVGKAFINCTGLTSVIIPGSVKRIGVEAIGYYRSDNGMDLLKVDDFTIYGYSGSAAETYADNNGFTFMPVNPISGDADGDGEVTAIDVTTIQRYIAHIKTNVSEDTLMGGDVDGNGVLEIVDATYIQRYLAHLAIPYTIG